MTDKESRDLIERTNAMTATLREERLARERQARAVRGPVAWTTPATLAEAPAPAPTPREWAAHVTAWTQTTKRFLQRLHGGRIPQSEVDAAKPDGSAAWHRLIERWGAEVAPDEGQKVGYALRARREAGNPVRGVRDFVTLRDEVEGGAA
jgi:hypothetical protein